MTITNCERCPALVKSRTTIVNPAGNLVGPDILFVGEGPGRQEDEQERPFVGVAGHVLASLVHLADVPKSAIALDNAVRCRPPGNRTPYVVEMANCKEFLLADIEAIQPKVIVALGAAALGTLYKKVPIASVLGQTLTQPDTGLPLIPTYHPAFLLRDNWSMCGLVAEHIRKAYRLATGQIPPHREGNYFVTRALEELKAVARYLAQAPLLAFDTETTGLDWATDELLCVQFSGAPGEGFTVPILQNAAPPGQKGLLAPYWAMAEFNDVLDILQELLGSTTPKMAQNGVFDLRFLERSNAEPIVQAATAFGFEVRNVEQDTMIASRTANENVPANLTTLTAMRSDIPYYEEEITKQSSNKKRMQDAKNEVTWKYGAVDVDVLQRIQPGLLTDIEAQGSRWLYDNLQVPLVRLVAELQKRGVLIDKALLRKLCIHYANEEETNQKAADALAGQPVALDWQALQALLYDDLKLPLPQLRTPSGKGCKQCSKEAACRPHAATSKTALTALYEQTEHPILPPILALKKITKFRSTYLDGSDEQTSGYARHIRSDGRIHAGWSLRTETGRLACSDPNLMNIPKNVVVENAELRLKHTNAIRDLFVAPPGCSIMNFDWSQLEVWGLAYRTGDQTLLNLLLSGQDVHTYVARQLCRMQISRLFPLVDDEMDDVEWAMAHEDIRGRAKTFVFGVGYGLTADGAAVRLGCTKEEAQPLIDAFLIILPTLPLYFEEIAEMVTTPPYAVPNWALRWRHFPEVPVLQRLGYRMELEAAIREGINYPIQSGGHDLHIAAWIRTEQHEGIMERAIPVIETHDSLAFETKQLSHEELVQLAWMTKNLWEDTAKNLIGPTGKLLGWQIPVEATWGKTLGSPEWKLTARGELKDLRDVL